MSRPEGVTTHTLRLELDDEPGELAAALEPIAENGGNLLSVFHERGSRTPGGRIPVEVALDCQVDRFEDVVEGLRDRGVTVVAADEEYYGEAFRVLLTGHLVDTDLSGTLREIEGESTVSVEELSLTAPEGVSAVSSAYLRLGARSGERAAALETVRSIAERKDLTVVEPLGVGE
ncbi:amino acid-binding protein [Halolamina litorea]|uniref:Amino acid-binding protein n=1 Tax=Halolamina litorea TaxID=1515593 RepID=A0ABD6BMJ4_9EURY|nr:amino acid-binding protein [Halolamina litorea]